MATLETLDDLKGAVAEALGDIEHDGTVAHGELSIDVGTDQIDEALMRLRDSIQTGFVCLIDIAGADYPEREKRFDIVYHLLSPTLNQRLRVRVMTNEDTPVASVTSVFPGADWYEREAYDLYGVLFSGHPDLRRLLTDYGFEGHPLRKDFPLTGFVEVRYDDEAKRVIYEPVSLRQEFRDFDFLSPWEGTEYALPGDEKAAEK